MLYMNSKGPHKVGSRVCKCFQKIMSFMVAPRISTLVYTSRELTHPKALLKMFFVFPRCDILVPWCIISIFLMFTLVFAELGLCVGSLEPHAAGPGLNDCFHWWTKRRAQGQVAPLAGWDMEFFGEAMNQKISKNCYATPWHCVVC